MSRRVRAFPAHGTKAPRPMTLVTASNIPQAAHRHPQVQVVSVEDILDAGFKSYDLRHTSHSANRPDRA